MDPAASHPSGAAVSTCRFSSGSRRGASSHKTPFSGRGGERGGEGGERGRARAQWRTTGSSCAWEDGAPIGVPIGVPTHAGSSYVPGVITRTSLPLLLFTLKVEARQIHFQILILFQDFLFLCHAVAGVTVTGNTSFPWECFFRMYGDVSSVCLECVVMNRAMPLAIRPSALGGYPCPAQPC